MKKYDYRGLAWVIKVIFQIGAAALAITLTALVAWWLFGGLGQPRDEFAVDICFALVFLIPAWLIAIALFNMYPTVWVGNECLMISCNLRRVRIAWEDIVDIGPCRGLFRLPGCMVIQAREITPFHFLYMTYTRASGWPAFLIHWGMQDRQELLDEIKRRAIEANSPLALSVGNGVDEASRL